MPLFDDTAMLPNDSGEDNTDTSLALKGAGSIDLKLGSGTNEHAKILGLGAGLQKKVDQEYDLVYTVILLRIQVPLECMKWANRKKMHPKKSQEQEDLHASSSVAEQQRSTAAPQQQYLSKYLFNSGIAKMKDFMDVTFLHVQALSVISRARTYAYT